MYHKILVPLDGSSFSERVLAHLTPFLEPHQTEVILLRVLEPYHPYGQFNGTEAIEQMTVREMWNEARQYVKGLQGELREQGILARAKVVSGDVTSVIQTTAENEGVDLIAMTTHGRSGVSRWALGSIADHVVRVVSQPVLLVRGDMPVSPKSILERVLVPLDGTVLAEQALGQAETLVRRSATTLMLLRAFDLKTEQELDGMLQQADGYKALRALRVRAVEGYLATVKQHLEEKGIGSRTFVHDVPPAEAILETAKREQVDLIVMSTHARSGLGRWMYGSVADTVLRKAPCPVLLERARKLSVAEEALILDAYAQQLAYRL